MKILLTHAYYKAVYAIMHILSLVCITTHCETMYSGGVYYNDGLMYNIPPLHRAATFGDIDMFNKLIHDGVSVDSEDTDGNTPLNLIVMNMNYPHNRQLLSIVLRLHPHMRIKSSDGIRPIHMVSRIDASVPDTLYYTLAQLLEFGAKITDRDGKGYTILDRIVEKYERQGTEKLLELFGPFMTDEMIRESIVRASQKLYYDPRDYALKKGRKKIADMDPIKTNVLGFNGLHCAVIAGDMQEAMRLLGKKTADVNKEVGDEHAMQPLHLAVLQENYEMVKLLVQHKANVNGTDAWGNTPLHLVVNLPNKNNAIQIAEHLLLNGAQKDAINKNGNTVLHLLVFYDNGVLIKALKQKYQLNDTIQNYEHETPRKMADRLQRKSLL